MAAVKDNKDTGEGPNESDDKVRSKSKGERRIKKLQVQGAIGTPQESQETLTIYTSFAWPIDYRFFAFAYLGNKVTQATSNKGCNETSKEVAVETHEIWRTVSESCLCAQGA